jgi:hypothetical protein
MAWAGKMPFDTATPIGRDRDVLARTAVFFAMRLPTAPLWALKHGVLDAKGRGRYSPADHRGDLAGRLAAT